LDEKARHTYEPGRLDNQKTQPVIWLEYHKFGTQKPELELEISRESSTTISTLISLLNLTELSVLLIWLITTRRKRGFRDDSALELVKEIVNKEGNYARGSED
jgi:hypothetical protein